MSLTASMFSPVKHEDKVWLNEVIEWIKLLAPNRDSERIKPHLDFFMEEYEQTKTRIQSHNYEKEDEFYYTYKK